MLPAPVRTRLELDLAGDDIGLRESVCIVADVVAPASGDTRGPLLMCWPGGGMSRRYWDLDAPGYSMATHLAAAGIVSVLVDHLGVGESSRLARTDDYTSEAVADADAAAVRAIRAACDADVIVGVGHSMGALFAVWQQARHDVYDGLVLLGFGVDGVQLDGAMAYAQAARAKRLGYATDDDTARGGTSTSDLLLAGMEVPEEAFRALQRTASAMVPTDGIERLRRGAPELAAINVPVLVGNGDRDITGDTAALLSGFPHSPDPSLFVLAGAGHNHNVAPNRHALWDEIAAWLTSRFPQPALA